MIYRRATKDDLNRGLSALILQGIYSDTRFTIDEDKLFHTCAALADPPNYSAVAIDHGQFVAYIGGQVQPHAWYPRSILNVIGWYSVKPMAGLPLLTRMMRWASAQPLIKSVIVTVNPPFVERVQRILDRRYGLRVITSFQIGV